MLKTFPHISCTSSFSVVKMYNQEKRKNPKWKFDAQSNSQMQPAQTIDTIYESYKMGVNACT